MYYKLGFSKDSIQRTGTGNQVPISTASLNLRKILGSLHSTDRLLVAFWCLLSLLSLVLHSRIPAWRNLLAANLAACIVACALARIAQSTGSRALNWIHDWAAFPMVVFTFKELYFIIGPLHLGMDYDRLLADIDRALFRVNPTFLTELLQIAYSMFYILFIAVGLELYRNKDIRPFRSFSFTVVYGFLISYVGYFFLPAVGPRFTLHNFSEINIDLPGLFLTPYLRWFVNFCESIPAGASNSLAMANAQRDVFPSGHTMMTVVTLYLAYRYRLRIRRFIMGAGILLIFGTVYLRYHYGIDVLAGAFLALPCLLTSGRMEKWLTRCFLAESDPATRKQEPDIPALEAGFTCLQDSKAPRAGIRKKAD
jgi:membrane-associated phospholipid phosphatase